MLCLGMQERLGMTLKAAANQQPQRFMTTTQVPKIVHESLQQCKLARTSFCVVNPYLLVPLGTLVYHREGRHTSHSCKIAVLTISMFHVQVVFLLIRNMAHLLGYFSVMKVCIHTKLTNRAELLYSTPLKGRKGHCVSSGVSF
jgi:hypothetical protein